MSTPFPHLLKCETCEYQEPEFIMTQVKFKKPLNKNCDHVSLTYEKVTFNPCTMVIKCFNQDQLWYSTKFNIIFDDQPFLSNTSDQNNEFQTAFTSILQSSSIGGLCGVSCLIFLLGEKHVKVEEKQNYVMLWQWIYSEILSKEWTYGIDFVLEQNIHELVKRDDTKEALNLRRVRNIINDLCKYREEPFDKTNPLLSRTINPNVRTKRNDIRHMLYNISSIYKMLTVMKKSMKSGNVSDDTYDVMRTCIDGLFISIEIKKIDEFYLKFPWYKELLYLCSPAVHDIIDQLIRNEYCVKLSAFKNALNVFQKFEAYVTITVFLNDLYTLCYILNPDIRRSIVYTGSLHSENLENYLTKYFKFRVLWHEFNENSDECAHPNEFENEDETPCYFKKKSSL
jgi:hypothetical protein